MERQISYFFVVGVMKGGTTSLFKYLKEHPDVWMPDEKEIPFFHNEDISDDTWRTYRAIYLMPKNGEKLAGTASPQYMCDSRIPERMSKFVPDAKIIIVVRDPIERAVSHYKMLARWGIEKRTFDDAVSHQLQPHILKLERIRSCSERGAVDDSYVCRGEYGRIVDLYSSCYPGKVLIICSDDLRDERKLTLERVFQFLGVDPDFVPKNMIKAFHKSEVEFVDELKKFVINSKLTKILARVFLSAEARSILRKRHFSYLSGHSERVTVSAIIYSRLHKHYLMTNHNLVRCEWFNKKPNEHGDYVF